MPRFPLPKPIFQHSSKEHFPRHIRLLFLTHLAFTLATSAPLAFEGSNPVFATTPNGQTTSWKTFEILSGNNSLGPRAIEGSITRLDLDPSALSAWIEDGIIDNPSTNATLS